MKKVKRICALFTTAALLLSLTACGGSETGTNAQAAGDTTTAPVTTEERYSATTGTGNADPAEQAGDALGSKYDATQLTGNIKWLGYYDLATDQPDLVSLFETNYGGTVESEICPSGAGYFEKLGTLINADMSPDLVRYEWMSYPHGMSKNMYTPLDDYINLDSELWSGIKSVADQYIYCGKHYYYPHEVTCNFALNYNRTVLEEAGLDDPMELYQSGNWTWNAFKELITKWCDEDETYVGYTGVGAMSFTATTGVKVIEVTSDGQIINNMKNQNIQRCMEFIEGLAKNNLIGTGYVSPQEAFKDGTLLFLGMEPTWCYKTAAEQLNKDGIEYDLAFIPFPRDESADTYSIATDNFGYMVPSGAKNIKGAVDWINLCRTRATDTDVLEAAHKKATDTAKKYYPKCKECGYNFIDNDTDDLDTCPDCNTARREKFNAVYSEEQWQILQDLKDPTKFNLLFDNVFGFSDDLKNIFSGGSEDAPTVLDGPVFHHASYTQLRDTYYNTVEAYLDPYRDKMATDMTA